MRQATFSCSESEKPMTKSSYKRRVVTQQSLDIWKLEEARHEFWLYHYDKCSDLIFPLCAKYVIEPLFDTQEYKDGEKKPPESVSEPEEEEPEAEDENSPWPDFLTKDQKISTRREERDDDGYLIREA